MIIAGIVKASGNICFLQSAITARIHWLLIGIQFHVPFCNSVPNPVIFNSSQLERRISVAGVDTIYTISLEAGKKNIVY